MELLIKSARIICSESRHHNKVCDVLIRNGKIDKIAPGIEWSGEIFEAPNLHLSAGWVDLRANFCDPGNEHKEDICSGLQAAKKGGFTGVCLVPETDPPVSSKSQVEYLRNRAKGSVTSVFPCGTLSASLEGKQLAELFDMQQTGAVAFTDGKKTMSDAGLMSTAMLYAKNLNALIISFPQEISLCRNGQIHEGEVSTILGLKGIPALAEELQLSRDIQLCEYNDARIHFTGISTEGGVELIRQAKKKGLKVTCDVYAHQLLINDKDLMNFDQNKKVMPPFRDETHRLALIEGLKDGTIDAICSDHTPEDVEHKHVEFENAAYGIIALESCFGVANTAVGEQLGTTELISKLSTKPRQILGLEQAVIEEGNTADLTLFDPELTWTFTGNDIRSKSANTPFVGTELKGRPIALVNNGLFSLC
jgi:dihydroorotase